MRVCILASGSRGNALFVASDSTRRLVDCGVSMKELSRRLAQIDEDPERVDALLVTHEHGDHAAAVPAFAHHRYRAEIFATPGTLDELPVAGCDRLRRHAATSMFSVGDLSIESFGVPHDGADPVGYLIRHGRITLAICTDLGYISDAVAWKLSDANVLILEANYDQDVLVAGPYPRNVQRRVLSRVGHLCNRDAERFLANDLNPDVKLVAMAHLSGVNNDPRLVEMFALPAIEQRRARPEFHIAAPGWPSPVWEF